MILTRLFPAPQETLDFAEVGTRDRMLELYRPPRERWLRLNLVASVSGSTTGNDGTSESLTNRSDRRILGVIRELSDVVVVGAASVRAEGYQLPRHSRLAIVTRSGNMSGHRISAQDASRVIVVCPAFAVAEVRDTLGHAEILIASGDDKHLEAGEIVDGLRAAGHESIVCEGGSTLAGQLAAAGLVDELCLTTSPLLGGVRRPLLNDGTMPDQPAALRQLIIDEESYVFALWAMQDGSGSLR